MNINDMQFGAGVILKRFDPRHPRISDEDIVCATSGGVQIEVRPNVRDLGENIPNAPRGTKELTYNDGWICELRFTAAIVTVNTLALALGAADTNGLTVAPRQIKDIDYIGSLWWVGDEGTSGLGFVAVRLIDALSVAGVTLITRAKGHGSFAVTIRAHSRLADPDRVPVELWSFPDGKEIPVNSESFGSIVACVKLVGIAASLAGGMVFTPVEIGEIVDGISAPATEGKAKDGTVADVNAQGTAERSELAKSIGGTSLGNNTDGDDSLSHVARHKSAIVAANIAKGDAVITANADAKSRVVLNNETDAMASDVPTMGKTNDGAVIGNKADTLASQTPANSEAVESIISGEETVAMASTIPTMGKATDGAVIGEVNTGFPAVSPTMGQESDGNMIADNIAGESHATPNTARNLNCILLGDNCGAWVEPPPIIEAGRYRFRTDAPIPTEQYIIPVHVNCTIYEYEYTDGERIVLERIYDEPYDYAYVRWGQFDPYIMHDWLYVDMCEADVSFSDEWWVWIDDGEITITADTIVTAEQKAKFLEYFEKIEE